MKIERLRFQAFGPYVEEQVIDFSQLPTQLFLIRGETGAGKTAILDAITYALYGYSSGGDRGELEAMRCRFARDSVKTFVECIICIHQKRYCFYRQVEVHTKRNKDVALKMTINAGELIDDVFYPFFENCKLRAVEEKAQQLIGLSHAQFIQVMMLPQGKFEQLLVSSSEAKQEILKSLFQSEKWTGICEYLGEKAKEEKEALDQTRVQIQLILQGSKIESMEGFEVLLDEVKQQFDQESKTLQTVHEHYQQVLKQLQEQRQYAALAQRFAKGQEELKSLYLQKTEMDALAQQVEDYNRYMIVKPYYDAMIHGKKLSEERSLYKQEIIKEEAKIVKRQHALIQESVMLEPKKLEVVKLKEDYAARVEELLRFEKYEQLQNEHTLLQKELHEKQILLNTVQSQYQGYSDSNQSLQRENSSIEQTINEYPQMLKQEQIYDAVLVNHQQCIQIDEEISNHKQVCKQLEKQLVGCMEKEALCESEHEEMYQQFLNHSADVLAQSLVDGKPCPVCGSTHHPKSTHIQIKSEHIENLRECKEALNKAKEQTQLLQGSVQVEQSKIQMLEQQVHTVQQQIRAVLTNGYNEQLHIQFQQASIQGKKCTLLRMENMQKIEKNIQLMKSLEEKIDKMQRESGQSEQALLHIQVKMEECNVTSDFQHSEQVALYIQKQKEIIDRYEQQITTNIQQTEELTQAYAIVKVNLERAIVEDKKQQAGYEEAKAKFMSQNIEIPQDMTFDEVQIHEASGTLKRYEQRCVEVESALKQLSSQVANIEIVDLNVLQKSVEEAQHAYQRVSKEVALYENQIQVLRANEKKAKKLQTNWEQRVGAYEQLNSFVKAMRGDNRMGIERYVLGVMLSQITQVANQLLQNVHHGRYQIYRSDETVGRVRKFGLELSIYDTYSYSNRSVISLSGGEKFLVSLALSLALSTVVQARSGGIYLETMFVDEGFGSLDEQSIADALQVLSSMGKQKAMIGIISHVEVLKENIPYGIQVKKQREGSSLTILR